MDYTTYQIIVLLDNSLSLNRKRNIIKEIRRFIEKCAGRVNIKYEETRNLAYSIEEHTNAWFVAMQIKMKNIGSNKRIKQIEEKLNTYEEIIDFKIIRCSKAPNNLNNDNKIYIVYEFDYGNINEGIEPNITIFDGYKTRAKAIEKANELLQEGLEKYYIDSYLADNDSPFKNNDEVHLYENEEAEEQENSIYYIKIERINLE